MKSTNLIVIMSDEHDPRFMGVSGHPLVKTPTFDRMASTGVNFTNAYTPCPICVPARAAFATGQYVHRIRHWDNAMPYTGDIRGWGHILQEKGIRVESIGKLHYRHAEDPAGPDVTPGVCRTPVDLLDLFPTILDSVGIDPASHIEDRPGKSVFSLAQAGVDVERPAFSEYHAVGSNAGGYMLRKGKWKFHYYVGYPPELFDLEADPEEATNLAADPQYASRISEMEAALRKICDPEAVDALAKSDQQALIEKHGGREKARLVGAPGATPPPK